MNSSNYLSEVSDLFIRRRGSTLNLSPLDWQIIVEWERAGIPLHIVCRAIDDVFDQRDLAQEKNKRPVKSISYCRDEIESAFENWLKMQVGK